MNRNSRNHLRESLVGGRNIGAGSQHNHRRGQADDNLDLFSKNRRSLYVASADESSDGTTYHHYCFSDIFMTGISLFTSPVSFSPLFQN